MIFQTSFFVRIGIGRLPARETMLEIFLENQRQLGIFREAADGAKIKAQTTNNKK